MATVAVEFISSHCFFKMFGIPTRAKLVMDLSVCVGGGGKVEWELAEWE